MPADPNHPMTDDVKDRVMHAHLQVGDTSLVFSDTFPGMPYQPGGRESSNRNLHRLT